MSSSDRHVATLLPSATEIVYALGAEPVATSHECDHPPAAAGKPNANRARVDPTAEAGEIDSQVQEADESGGVYEIRGDVLAEAAPDIVVSQGICDVCAVDEVLVREAIEEYELDCELLTTDPHSLADLYRDIEQVGEALGREERAHELVDRLRSRVAAIESRVPDREPKRVAVFDWTDPVMVAGHWIPGMVERLGSEFGLQEPEAASRPLEWDTVREYDPEVVVVAPCGFELDQTHENLDDLTERDGWSDLAAVRDDRVYAVDGHSLMNRPGPRLVESLEALAWCLYPDEFDRPAGDAAERL
ncbi:ABC transporter substrate-binding protein [Halosegnis rubeus]|jgi:iron complex transport system substrate-binding protein|uniref:ABC transporter substrate-binding protein n=1 Tax=Halosegnis rubeus TaxID=2212850 RepID=A0A5N5UFU2_9EURY|nr:ABC transporter substrate-binding protein [Halosegnis rubeus]KAB7516409.1 ABC transporter substrate-binding protein [Halosegnis rubeus]KAB7517602.1 ABC transporter substrate-binding protein [Halosegnis rubeus]